MKKLILFCVAAAFMAVSCSQEAVSEGAASVKAEVTYCDTVSAKVMFTPTENSAYYEYVLVEGEAYNDFANRSIDGIVRVEGNEAQEVVFPSLLPFTVYTVYAESFAEGGTSAGVTVCKFSTEDSRFNIRLNYVLDKSAGVRITFPREYYACRYYLGTAADREAFINNTLDCQTVTDIRDFHVENYFDLTPATEYVFYAIGTDRLGLETKLFELPFTTFAESECPSVEVSSDIDIYKGKYVFTPNAKCGKVIASIQYDGLLAGYLTGFSNDIVDMLLGWEGIQWQGTSSAFGGKPLEMEYINEDLTNDFVTEAMVVVCDENMNPAGVRYFRFSTPSFDETLPLPNKVDIQVSDITSKGATYHFTADESVLGYMYDTVDADWYDDFKENDSEWYDTYLHDRFFRNGYYFHYGSGEHTWTEETGQTNYRYYAAAAPMNGNGPRKGGWGEITLVEYTTNK